MQITSKKTSLFLKNLFWFSLLIAPSACKTSSNNTLQSTFTISEPAQNQEGWWIYLLDGSYVHSQSIHLRGRILEITSQSFPTLKHIELSQLKAIAKFPLNKAGDDAFLSRKEEGVFYKPDPNTVDNTFKSFDFLESTILEIEKNGIRLSEFDKNLPFTKVHVIIFRNESSKILGKIKSGDLLLNPWIRTNKEELLFASELNATPQDSVLLKPLSIHSNSQDSEILIPKSLVTQFHIPEKGVLPFLSLKAEDIEITCDQKPITQDNLQYSLCIPRVLNSVTDEFPNLEHLRNTPALRLVSTTSLVLKLSEKLPKGGTLEFEVQKTSEVEDGEVLLKIIELNSDKILLNQTFGIKNNLPQKFKVNLSPKSKLKFIVDEGGDGFIGDTLLIYHAKILLNE